MALLPWLTAGVSDFSQNGVVPTLHDLGHRSTADLERDLRSWAADRPVTVIIPGLASDIDSEAFEGILAELADADWLDHVIVGLDDADVSQYLRACRLLDGLPQPHHVLWTGGPALARTEALLRTAGLAPRQQGKGRNVWYCLGALLGLGRSTVIAIHDADISGYRRSMLSRLVYPVAHPRFGYKFAKGYYHRVTDGRFGGRVTRLLVAPLVRALSDLNGDQPYLRYLEAFRYPLAGESAMTAELAADLRIPGHWGMDIGLLGDVYAHCDPSSICQVAVADAYDHKHQALSAGDPSGGLRRMSVDVTATVIRRLGLGADGIRADRLCDAYTDAAKSLVRHYANDAEINGYLVDVADEEATVGVFARSVADAVELCRADPSEDPANPCWRRVFDEAPEAVEVLVGALADGGDCG